MAYVVGVVRCGGETPNFGLRLTIPKEEVATRRSTFHTIHDILSLSLQSGGSLEVFSNPRFNKQE